MAERPCLPGMAEATQTARFRDALLGYGFWRRSGSSLGATVGRRRNSVAVGVVPATAGLPRGKVKERRGNWNHPVVQRAGTRSEVLWN